MYKWFFILNLILFPSLGFSQDDAVTKLAFYDSEKKTINNCSGTLIKMNSQCAVITNAHCFSPGTISVEVTSKQLSFTFTEFIIDSTKDLAEIKVGDEKSEMCNLAFEVDPSQETELLRQIENRLSRKINNSYKSLGYVDNKLVTRYSRDSIWPMYGYSMAEKVSTSLSDLEYLIQVPFLQMSNGMSGGPVYDMNGLIGIKKSFIPFQNTTQVISLADIFKFIKSHRTQSSANRIQNNRLENGGENSGTNGGDSANQQSVPLSTIDKLLEPNEGIKLDPNEKRLLAIGNYQIDGLDDYNLVKNKSGIRFYEDSKEFEKEKSLILQRMFPETAIKKNIADGGVNLITLSRGVDNIPYSSSPAFSLFSDLSWNQRTASVDLNVSNYSLFPNNQASLNPDYNVPAKRFSFKMELSGDNNILRVTENDGTSYTCKNKFFFKIICTSRGLKNKNLSFSRSRATGDVLRFRYTIEANDTIIVNYFGTLEPQ